MLTLVYRSRGHLFWEPKLRPKSQPTKNSFKLGLSFIILNQSCRYLCRAMASGANAPEASFRGFTEPPKPLVPKEKNRFAWLLLPKSFF